MNKYGIKCFFRDERNYLVDSWIKAPKEHLSKDFVVLVFSDEKDAREYARTLQQRAHNYDWYEARLYDGKEETVEKYW